MIAEISKRGKTLKIFASIIYLNNLYDIFYIPDWADVQLMKTSSTAKIATLFSILSLVFRSYYTRGLFINKILINNSDVINSLLLNVFKKNKTVIIIFLSTFSCHTISEPKR